MTGKNCISLVLLWAFGLGMLTSQEERLRDLGVEIGVMTAGPLNAITDVAGVLVGHTTRIEGDQVRTGVTAILPHGGNIFQSKVPGAVYVGNGFGKLAGSTQVQELGNIETPIILTNTLSVPVGMQATVRYTLNLPGNENVRSVNALVGETNDGRLNDIRGMHVTEQDVIDAIESASGGKVEEGNVGAGTGTICFGYKGGIGTASRALPDELGAYTVGVLVQTNFGGNLKIDDIHAGELLEKYPYKEALNKGDGSCMIVVATDAPVAGRNLERMAMRAMLGLANTGGIASNGSGDYVIAFSTFEGNRVPYNVDKPVMQTSELHNDRMTPLFMATIEATEEAILNSMVVAETMTGRAGHTVERLPIEQILKTRNKAP